jgi:uncharacterized Zn-binding protein involved in type VI secretion
MKPAARQLDQCVHGGKLTSGSPDTTIGGMPAARLGDAHVCPIPGHVAGKIVSASSTVFINAKGAARVLDTIACASPAVPPPGKTHKKAAEYKVTDDDNYVKAFYADHVSSDYDKDGTIDKHKVGLGMIAMQGEAEKNVGPVALGARGKLEVLNATGEIQSSVDRGVGVQAAGRAVMTSKSGSVYVGPKDDGGKNPYLEVGGKHDVMVAEAGLNVLAGDDGKRVGVVAMGKLSADATTGEGRVRFSIPIWPGYTIDVKAAGSAGAGSLGGELGGGAYYDKEEHRTHFLAAFAVGVALKLGINLDISIGRKFGFSPPAPAPDAVAMGCMTVFIGG